MITKFRKLERMRFDESGKLLALSNGEGIDIIKTKGWKKLT